jgi:hypothetical protein
MITITEEDKRSGLWLKLNEYFDERAKLVLDRLERDSTEHETAILRGNMQEIRRFQNLTKELPKME